jgi:hypothetical protein
MRSEAFEELLELCKNSKFAGLPSYSPEWQGTCYVVARFLIFSKYSQDDQRLRLFELITDLTDREWTVITNRMVRITNSRSLLSLRGWVTDLETMRAFG